MGNNQTSELIKTVGKKLAKEDIKKYYKFWTELFPNGNMTPEGFKKFVKITSPEAPEDAEMDYLFRALDQDKDGTVTFKEFIIFQSVFNPTTKPFDPSDTIDFLFDMYDENGDGHVTVEELRDCYTKIERAQGKDVASPEVVARIQKRVEYVMKVADRDGDNKLTKTEVMDAYRTRPEIMGVL